MIEAIKDISSPVTSVLDTPTFAEQVDVAAYEYDEFRIEIANTFSKLMDAAHLGYKGYLKKGFVNKSKSEYVFNDWDISGDSVCVVAYDRFDKCVGTMTVVPDLDRLPGDATFKNEIDELRSRGAKLCEFTRFVIDEDFRNQKPLLTSLMEIAPLIVEFHFNSSDLLVEVNPRHQTYYIKKVLFETETVIKDCNFVNNAPAVLLRIPISTFTKQRSLKRGDTACKRLVFDGFITKDPIVLENMINFITKESKKIRPQPAVSGYMEDQFRTQIG